MNRFCACGGKMVLLHPQNRFYFRAKCSKCGVIHKQRKRQPKR